LAVLTPTLIKPVIGAPLLFVADYLSSGIMNLMSLPVSWEGGVVRFVSQGGEAIRVTVSTGCAGISSITMFLLLCGLMHLDLKKPLSFTLKFVVLGSLTLIIVNAIRIETLVWTGYMYGSTALWSLHEWLCYAIFIGFYLVILVVYLGVSCPLKASDVGDTNARQQ
jgi:exosortase/archaeosortase family protein